MPVTGKHNVIIVMLDTLRARSLGCYGNETIQTPNFDGFAAQSVRFTRAYPESLPTIPVRRALHTGRRAYPFRDYRTYKWGTVQMPGWQPIGEDEDTLAENLAGAGYHTGFVCTTQHCWNPSFNFQRGFYQWEFVRGYSGEDRWGSPFGVPRDALRRYGDPDEILAKPYGGMSPAMVMGNRGVTMVDEETATANAFKWAAQFLEHNREQLFYLLIDSFAPHEPWEAPEKYFRMYGDPDYDGPRHLSTCYGPADNYTDEEVANIKAHYAGLVTHVDNWFGHFMQKLDALGLGENTTVVVTSDHGTNLCDNPRNVIGKPTNAMYPGVMQLPLLVRSPGGVGAGTVCDELVYDQDITATAYEVLGVGSEQGIDGRSLLPLLSGGDGWRGREYATCRYGNSVCCIDDQTWALGDIDGNAQDVFDLQSDSECMTPLDDGERASRWRVAWERLLDDAGGAFPDYRPKPTDALGR